jgi:hypothetical protein
VSKTARAVALLFVLALTVRLFVVAWTFDGFDPAPVEDERGYVELATAVAGKQTFFGGSGYPPQFTLWRLADANARHATGVGAVELRSFRGPVVPLLFAPVVAEGGGVGWMRFVSLLCGSLGPPLLFLALRTSPLGDRAWWPAAAYALWPPAVYVSVRAISEAPSQALLIGALATLCLPRSRNGVFAGALAALSVLARPAALIPAGLLVFATGSKKRAALFVATFVVVMSPWVIRNWTIHGRPLLTTNSGVTLVGGNCQAALDAEHPGKWVAPDRVYEGDPDAPDLGMWGWSNMTEEASDRRFASDAMRWVKAKPGRAATLCFWKLVRLFDPDQHSEKADSASKAWIGWLTFAPVLLLAVLGLGAWRDELPWTMLVLGTIVTALIFYGDVRMRTCADPALLVFAAHGVSRFARPAADRNRTRSVV